MTSTCYILSGDATFAQFVRLCLCRTLRSVAVLQEGESIPAAPYYVVDLDTYPLPRGLGGTVLCTSALLERPQDLPYLWLDRPFRPARLLAALGLAHGTAEYCPQPIEGTRGVLVEGACVALSKTEHALFLALWEANGAFVSKEELLRRVWSPDTDPGIVGVYVHYLREKLEAGGKRYIIAHRGRGYRLPREEDNLC